MLHPERTDYTEFRDDFAGQYSRMRKAKAPTYILRKGKADAVVLSLKEFAAYQEGREYFETVRAVEESRAQIAAGLDKPARQSRKKLEAKLGIERRKSSRRSNRGK